MKLFKKEHYEKVFDLDKSPLNEKEFIPVAEAVATLVLALKADPDYRRAWQANIAMAFYDEFCRSFGPVDRDITPGDIHPVANRAADNFLNILCRDR